MNLLTLRYFVAVVERGSIRNAAKTLYISEQSLSERIIKLENELETKLLNRTRPQTLTTEGEIFFAGAKQALSVMDDTLKAMHTSMQEEERTIRLGTGSIGIPVFLPDLIVFFQKKYPSYRITTVRLEPHEKDVEIDLRFLPWFDTEAEEKITICKDQGCVLVSQELMDATFGAEVGCILKKMQTDDFETFFQKVPCLDAIGKNDSIKTVKGISTSQRLHFSNDINMDFRLCINGVGYIIGPERDIRYQLAKEPRENIEKMLLFPLKTMPFPDLAIGYAKGHCFSQAELDFIDSAKEFFSQTLGFNS